MFRIREDQLAVLSKEVAAANILASLRADGFEADWHPEQAQVTAKDAKGNESRLRINDLGHLMEHQTPSGRTFRFNYDDDAQLSSAITPSGSWAAFSYDHRGLVSLISTSEQQQIAFAWDDDGRMLRCVLPDKSSIGMRYATGGQLSSYTDRTGRTASLDWDDRGNLTSITDFNGYRTHYRYGKWDRPETTIRPNGVQEQIVRNKEGRPVALKINGDLWANVESDDQARITKLTYADGHFVELQYDDQGRVAAGINPAGVVTREYDDKGRLVLEDQGGEAVRWEYDAAGLLKTLAAPGIEPVHFHYDADGRLREVTDWQGGRHEFTYVPGDRIVEHRLPNGVKVVTSLASGGLPSEIRTTPVATGSPALSLRFAWNTTGKLIRLDDSELGTREFAYDGEGRVIAATGSRPETFGYDGNGNRTYTGTEIAQFDESNRMVRQGARTYSYDPRGNLVADSGPEGTARYTFNGQNLLTAAELPDGRRIEYVYDAFARLILRRAGKTQTKYLWAGDQLLAEITTSGPVKERRDYIFVPHSYCPLSMRLNGNAYYFLVDHKGCPRWLLDRQGSVAWSADYAAFGQTRLLAKRVDQPIRFAGHYADPDTGLNYCRARFYSPAQGRYLSTDPLDIVSGLNLYAYAENDPIKKSDPLGLLTFWQGVGAAALVVAGVAIIAVAAPVVVAAMVAVAKGTAVAAGTAAAAAAVVGGAALVGAGVGLAVAPSRGTLKCKIHYALRGAVIGAGAAIAVMSAGFGAAGLVAAGGMGGGGGLALVGGGTMVASVDAALGGAAGAIAGGIVMMTGGRGGGGDDEYEDDEEEYDQGRGEKGKSFRGGKKADRDNWYGKNDKDFQRWWHREGKAQHGGRDIENAEEAQQAYDDWVSQGKPRIK